MFSTSNHSSDITFDGDFKIVINEHSTIDVVENNITCEQAASQKSGSSDQLQLSHIAPAEPSKSADLTAQVVSCLQFHAQQVREPRAGLLVLFSKYVIVGYKSLFR